MKTKIYPHGTMLEIHHNVDSENNPDMIFYCLLLVDFDLYKTFGNFEIDVEVMTLFDEEYNKIPYGDPLYDELSEIVQKIVIEENEDDDEDDQP